jgi:hypothetical protein
MCIPIILELEISSLLKQGRSDGNDQGGKELAETAAAAP